MSARPRTPDPELAAKARLLLKYRLARGFTQAGIAEKIGVDRQIIARAEKGQAQLSPEVFAAFCRIIGIDPIALLRAAGFTAFKESTK
jgi:transcriptional regulator with XRE-family HTH domain